MAGAEPLRGGRAPGELIQAAFDAEGERWVTGGLIDPFREPTRILFRRLAPFRGGLTLEAAEAVVPGGAIGSDDVLELVGRLVDRSLLVVREGHGSTRYHLLEPVRQYAAEKLVAAEEEEVRARQRGPPGIALRPGERRADEATLVPAIGVQAGGERPLSRGVGAILAISVRQ